MSSELPIRVIVFASEQLFPALQFLLHTAHRFGSALQSIHIYCTDDERRSGAPARRLQDVMQRWGQQNNLDFSVDITTGEMWPVSVRQGLLAWFERCPDSHWLVNVTGGTKPMSAAAIELTLSTDLSSRRVIYQEINGPWVELIQDEEGLLDVVQLSAVEDDIIPPPHTLDQLLSVEDLVATQFSEQHSITTQSLPLFPIDEATRHVMAQKWHWQTGLSMMEVPTISNGDAFERYIGVGLAACGVYLKHSLKVVDSKIAGKVVREVDLVGCYRGQLICIDIKLPGADEHAKGTQLADVAELAHSLGGRGALAIAVRPGWPEDTGTRRLADALGVRLLMQTQSARVFTTILSWIDKKKVLPAAVLEVERVLQAHSDRGHAVLSDGRSIVMDINELGTLRLPKVIEEMSERRGTSWLLVHLLDGTYILAVSKKSRHAPPFKEWPQVKDNLSAALKKVAVPYKNDILHDKKEWVFTQFIFQSGVSEKTVIASIRSVFDLWIQP